MTIFPKGPVVPGVASTDPFDVRCLRPSNGGAMGFGDMLKTMREKAGLSQSQLAERSGLSLRSIQNWEQGHRVPRAQMLLALARGVGVPVEKLLTEIGGGAPAESPPAPPKKRRKPKGE